MEFLLISNLFFGGTDYLIRIQFLENYNKQEIVSLHLFYSLSYSHLIKKDPELIFIIIF
jgi:hypothetical protein